MAYADRRACNPYNFEMARPAAGSISYIIILCLSNFLVRG